MNIKDFIVMALIVGFLGILISIEISTDKECKSVGGTVVQAYGSNNCWKDGQFIEIK